MSKGLGKIEKEVLQKLQELKTIKNRIDTLEKKNSELFENLNETKMDEIRINHHEINSINPFGCYRAYQEGEIPIRILMEEKDTNEKASIYRAVRSLTKKGYIKKLIYAESAVNVGRERVVIL